MKKLDNVVLGTGSYSNVKSGNTVSITGDGGNAWGYYGPSYKKMAPKLDIYLPYAEQLEEINKLKNDLTKLKEYLTLRKKIEDEYIKKFYEVRLKDLNIERFLLEMRGRFGNDIIFLCHEDVDEFCHRRLLADYLEIKTGIYIPEVSVDSDGNVKKLLPIRYKNRLLDVMKK